MTPAHPARGQTVPTTASYRLYESSFQVMTRSATVLDFLDRIYRRQPAGSAPDDCTGRYRLMSVPGASSGRYEVAKNEEPATCFRSLGAALYHLEFLMALQVCADHRDLVPLHGATVYNRRGEAAFLTGPSGAGKSTLTLGLAAHGLKVGGDDLALFDPRDGTVRPVPRCFHLDARTRRLLRGVGLTLPARSVQYGFVTPADLGVTDPPPRPVKRLVYLGPPAPDGPSLRRMSQGEMAVKLMSETPRAARSPGELLQVLRPLVECEGHLLGRGRMADTVAAVSVVLEAA